MNYALNIIGMILGMAFAASINDNTRIKKGKSFLRGLPFCFLLGIMRYM